MEKEAKLAAKKAKNVAAGASGEKQRQAKVKEKKKDEEVPFVNTTPKGHKKGKLEQ